tara:strand:+ start:987 stop:1505 length:519 start_codon:yes stop_codon:yes gene_type:complete
MRNKFFLIFLVIIFLAIFFILFEGLKNSNFYTPNLSKEKNIPSFNAYIFETKNEINSETFFLKDKFYLINIWASWCIPCQKEHSFLVDLSKIKNIEIIGINYKDKKKNANNFLKKLGNPYKFILEDRDGIISIEWGAYGVPETFLVYEKKIIKKITGPLNESSVLEIKKLLK